MKRSALGTLGIAVALLVLASVATADVPRSMNYQGHLTNEAGSPLDTVVSVAFSIYDDWVALTGLWTETHTAVSVENGLLVVLLGSETPIEDTVFADSPRWLGVTVGSDPEIRPRTRLVSVPCALRIQTLDEARGGEVYGDLSLRAC